MELWDCGIVGLWVLPKQHYRLRQWSTLGQALHGDNGCQIQLLRVRGYCGTVDSQYYVLGGSQIHLHSWSDPVVAGYCRYCGMWDCGYCLDSITVSDSKVQIDYSILAPPDVHSDED